MSDATLLGLIGDTPLVELRRMAPKPGVRIFAKLEGQNPSGSVKDRIALAMVERAEQQGLLHPGDTIVEASSGNTAIALAMIAKQKGYAVRVIIPGEVAPSIGDLLELYGAEITWCEPRAGMKGAIDLALEMSREDGFHYVGQFDNPMNLQTHYATTGDEIARALPVVDVLVAGIGTGGTITGVGRRLREANPDVKIRRRAAYGGSLAGPPQPVGGLRAAFAGFEPAQPAVPGRQCHRH
jgi:cysteine synthase B